MGLGSCLERGWDDRGSNKSKEEYQLCLNTLNVSVSGYVAISILYQKASILSIIQVYLLLVWFFYLVVIKFPWENFEGDFMNIISTIIKSIWEIVLILHTIIKLYKEL